MLALAVLAIATARIVEHSKLGYGFAAIRDDEMAAEASGVPTLKLKLIATTLSGALMGMAGAPVPHSIGYSPPPSPRGLEKPLNPTPLPLFPAPTPSAGPPTRAIPLVSPHPMPNVP